MKYAIILGDGMADYKIPSLAQKTPLQAARKPFIDALAKKSELGLVSTVPPALSPGSDVANLSVLGYDPAEHYTGRSPLEAASIGIPLSGTDLTLRANFVTLSGEERYEDRSMEDYSAGEISTAEAAELIAFLKTALDDETTELFAGVSYRHCLIYKDCPEFTDFSRPHDILGKTIRSYLPHRRESAPFLEMQKQSFDVLNAHPLNLRRAAQGLKKANSLWFWSPGKKPSLPPFSEKYGLRATVVSAVDLIKGIGICAGMRVADVPGATGTLDTNYRGKMEAAADALLREGSDLVYVHVEAPDECGHRGELMNKVSAIERIDAEILGPLLKRMNDSGEDYAVLVLPDHPTPIRVRTHTHAPVPFVIYRRTKELPSGFAVYDEESGRRGGVRIRNGFELMDFFLGNH